MKYTISLFLLLLATTAYADKNKKNTQAQTVPASKPAPSDNKEQQEFGYRSYDARTVRRGYVAPDSADIVKYGLKKGGQRDTL